MTKTIRAAALLATIGAALLALSVGPAAAASQTRIASCDDGAQFSALQALTSSTVTDARTEKETESISGSTEIGQKTPGKPTAGVIDVYFHVVTTTSGTGAVSAATVDDQIGVLNMTFGGFYGGANTGFSFRLAGTETTANNAWYGLETFADEIAMKSALKQGDSTDLNIYSGSGGGYLGWAYYPSITNSQNYGVLDGVVLHYGSLPGGYIANYDLGYTATHEVGHWLGLPHTFSQGCIGHGDYSDDTAAQASPTSGCPIGRDSCPKAGLDPIHNYRDYSYDACYSQFTPNQTARMQKQFAHWRLKRA